MHSKEVFLKEQYKGFCETPSLFLGEAFNLPNSFPTPYTTVENFDKIKSELQKQDYLGKRMEYFFHSWVNQHKTYQLIAHSIQIKEEKTTIGELDFLVREVETNKILHIELVYKCYIWDASLSQNLEEALVGPNYKDYFKWKTNKLVNHQFPLLKHPKTTEKLLELIPSVEIHKIEQRTCFKAQVFVPPNQQPNEKWLNPQSIVGNWLNLDEFKNKDWSGCTFHIPFKFLWPCSIAEIAPCVDWISYEEILPIVSERLSGGRAPMLWVKKNINEYQKYFILI
jgi:hypothetical protein